MIPSTPIRKPANINVSPVGNQGNKAQSNVLPSHQVATPFGGGEALAYKRNSAPVSPTTVPINDKDAGNGTGNLRSASKKSGMSLQMKGAD